MYDPWSLWEERNHWLFEDVEQPFLKLLDGILSQLFSWLLIHFPGFMPPFRSWIFYWDAFIF